MKDTQSDLDSKLDYLLLHTQTIEQEVYQSVLEIWKRNNALILLNKRASDQSLFTSMFDADMVPVKSESDAIEVIKTMGFTSALKFLKHIQSIRNL